jgi:hypothetical protein
MPDNELQPDSDAIEQWRNLPQNAPSRQALPPATGGTPRWLWALIGLGVLILVVGALSHGV